MDLAQVHDLSTPLLSGFRSDLGQTEFSENTAMHVLADPKQQFTIIAGDLSYADGDQTRWDRWGNLFEPLLSSRIFQPAVRQPSPIGKHDIPFIIVLRGCSVLCFVPHKWCESRQVGNHEIETKDKDHGTLAQALSPPVPDGKTSFIPFQSYQTRFKHAGPEGGYEGTLGGISASLWYSYSAGPAHFIHLSSYSLFTDGSPQKVMCSVSGHAHA